MKTSPSSPVADVDQPPLWRREPYLLFFPAGVILGWTGILHWLLHVLRYVPDYRPIFHAMTQIQGFMTLIAVGFLLTMIPRRTETPAPETWQVAVCLVAPFATVVAAWYRAWNLSQVAWLAAIVTLTGFVLRRLYSADAGRRPPNAFVWIPMGLLMGITGAAISLAYDRSDPSSAWLHGVASDLVLQGVLVGFVLGAGGLALPLMTREDPPPDATPAAVDTLGQLAHAGAALLIAVSFWIEATRSLPLAMILRAAVITAVYLLSANLWKLPQRPGWNARAIWIAAWMVPLGYVVAALFPMEFKAGLHVTFIGGFAALGLFISTQVTLGHGGYTELRTGKPWSVPVIGLFVAAATATRVAMEFDERRFFLWMALAAFSFICAAMAWGVFLIPKLVDRAVRG